jgi:hypothetical protein
LRHFRTCLEGEIEGEIGDAREILTFEVR